MKIFAFYHGIVPGNSVPWPCVCISSQAYFNSQLEGDPNGDGTLNHINTRDELREYDPRLFALLEEAFPCGNHIIHRCADVDQHEIHNHDIKMNCPFNTPSPTLPETCVDKHDSCAGWAQQGECEDNPGFMNRECARSCGSCDLTICRQIVPSNCIDCMSLGKACVGDHQKKCEDMGWNPKTNTCEDTIICPPIIPSNCDDCTILGPDCVREHTLFCKSVGWDFLTNTCGIVCPPIAVDHCDDCTILGKECVEQGGYTEQCNDMGWEADTNTCGIVCPSIVPSNCDDCTILGPDCVREHTLFCKSVGWDFLTNTCGIVCPPIAVDHCDDCTILGKDCVDQEGYTKQCRDMAYVSETNSCPNDNGCKRPSECSDCTFMDKKCLKKYKKECKALGYKKKKCPTDPINCPPIEPDHCDDCTILGSECLFGEKRQNCVKMGWKAKKNKCKSKGGEKCQKAKNCKGMFAP